MSDDKKQVPFAMTDAFDAWFELNYGETQKACAAGTATADQYDFRVSLREGWSACWDHFTRTAPATADARDASRYRWLREHRLFPSTSTFINAVELDEALDAAMQRGGS